MKRVLVTGATGFIGRHSLTELLARGYEVHASKLAAEHPGAADVAWHDCNLLAEGDVTVLLARIKPTHLLHFAWNVTPGKYQESPENLPWVIGGLHLIQAFVRAGGQRVVYAGTCYEYDLSHGLCQEQLTPARPNTLYGWCKLSLGQIVRDYCRQAGISGAWGRIFYLYGPGEHPSRLVSSVILNLLQGREAPCSHGLQIRDFMHVQDVAGAFVALLDGETAGIVNIASGQPIRIRDLVQEIARQAGREDLVRLGALPPSPDPPVILADTTRLRTEVGWAPRLDLSSGVKQTIEWWRSTLAEAQHKLGQSTVVR